MTKYYHPNYGLVTVVGQFSSHTNVKTLSGIKAVQFRDLQLVDANGNPVSTDYVVFDPELTQRKPALAAAPKAIAASNKPKPSSRSKPKPELPAIEVVASPVEDAEDDRISVNDTFTTIHLNVPGIGRSRARSIVERRPPEGYTSIEQFHQMNDDLIDDKEAWELIFKRVKI